MMKDIVMMMILHSQSKTSTYFYKRKRDGLNDGEGLEPVFWMSHKFKDLEEQLVSLHTEIPHQSFATQPSQPTAGSQRDYS